MVFRVVFFLGVLSALLASHSGSAQETDFTNNYQIIANGTDLTEITFQDLIKYYRGKFNSWESKVDVIIVLPSSKHTNAEKISEYIYSKSFYGVKKFWLSIVFQGRFSAPHFMDSDEEIVEFVSKNKGAIGLVSNKTNVSKQLLINLKE
jgi:ABC-type phosphate transport system substrate-binding protein